MALDRLFRQNVWLGVAYPEAFANMLAPTAAELNNTTLVKDLTCALWEDSTEFTLGDPDLDEGLTFCSSAGDKTAISKNPSVTFAALRDKDRVASGLFGTAFDHMAFADIPLVAIKRIGKPNTTLFAINDYVSLVRVKSDKPVDELASGANALLIQNFLNDDLVSWNYKVVA
jgi:hypothetical protein